MHIVSILTSLTSGGAEMLVVNLSKEYVAGDYSIADMAIYPWIVPYENQKQNLDDFPDVKRWFATMQARPAVIRAYETKETLYPKQEKFTAAQNAQLFGLKK